MPEPNPRLAELSDDDRQVLEKPEPLPEQFGRYRIIKRLGQGGMGSVYLAQDTQLERRVALKVPDFGDHEGPEARRRFLGEARAAATLDHPYLCPRLRRRRDRRPALPDDGLHRGPVAGGVDRRRGLAAAPGRGAGGQARPGLAGGAQARRSSTAT